MNLAKTTFELTVLHEANRLVKNMSLDDLLYETNEGDCLGQLRVVGTEPIAPRQARAAMLAMGNDGEFFEGRGDDEEDENQDDSNGDCPDAPPAASNGSYPTTGYGKVEWSVGDITCLVNVTDEQAAAWLARNHKHIQSGMVAAGWDVIHTLIAMDNPANPSPAGSMSAPTGEPRAEVR